ncbi:MAG: hypothetical protein ACREXW_03805 [Gammaproteobacteria bacterium]
MMQVPLNPGLRGGKWAGLRPLRGHDEAFLNGTDSAEAVAFLDRLLVEAPGTTVAPGRAKELAVCDCDRLFATLYLNYFGERIEGTVACQDCNEPFESSFSLRDLIVSLENGAAGKATGPDEEGIYTLPDARRFRLPTAGDQRSVLGLEAEKAAAALLERCVVEGDPREDPDRLQAAMDEVGALLDFDLEATCPQCGASQPVRFSIQSYVLRALAFEKRFLNREVHRIAMAYGWGHDEILNLTREDRRTFVRLIDAEQAAWRRVRW